MRILAIAGSLRKESYNRQLACAAQEMVATIDPSIDFRILEWADVPLFNQDIEFPTPEPVSRVRAAVKEADGLWIFTPEYNHSYPGVLKNLIDWLSRPVGESEGQVLAGKPVAFCGASIGMSGTAQAQDLLVSLLSYTGMHIMSAPRFVLPYVGKQTDEESRLALSASKPFLERQSRAFIDFIEKCSW